MSDAPTPVIAARGLTRRFGAVVAVNDLSLTIGRGEIFALLGPDGAGKTTTLRMLCGALQPSEGEVEVEGIDLRHDPEAVRGRVGYMPQRFSLYGDLSVVENLDFYADLFAVPRDVRAERAPRLLEFSGLTAFTTRLAEYLSGGMKQKLALACTLIHEPNLLLLDEPTAGVDPVSRREFWRILYDLNRRGVTILVSTTYMDEADRCTTVGLMYAGEMIATEDPGVMKRRMHGDIVEIVAAPKAEARRILRQSAEVLSETAVGDRFRILVADAGRAVPQLAGRLAGAGVRVREARQTSPSLEDVFVSVIAPRRAAAPPSGAARSPERATAESPATAARAEGLTRRYGSFVAVDHVSFEIPRGAIWGFLGPNGAGKSTTIRMLCAILAPSEGSAEVLGFDVTRDPEQIKARIGYMSQRFSLYHDLTVEQNLAFYAGIYGLSPEEGRGRAREWIARAGLGDRARMLAGALSGGWKQRLAFGCAVLHRPQMVFLDEPTSGVDPVSRREFWDLIDQFAESGTTVMVTTHYMDEAEHCDTLAFIYAGRIIAMGTPEEIKARQMAGELLEITTPRYADALEVLAARPEVREAALFGRAIHVTVEDAQRALPGLRAALAARGIAIDHVAAIRPSLEDAFVSLVEQRIESGRGAGAR